MVIDSAGRWRAIAAWSLRVLLGLMFLLVGIGKLSGTGNTVEYFTAIGWGQWFRYLTGMFDIVGAGLLFVPRCTCYGAAVIAASAGLATVISLSVLRGDSTWGGSDMVLIPGAFTLLAAALAWMTRPHAPR